MIVVLIGFNHNPGKLGMVIALTFDPSHKNLVHLSFSYTDGINFVDCERYLPRMEQISTEWIIMIIN